MVALAYAKCASPTRHSVLGKGVTNPRTINLLTYIILKNYLENINLQKNSYTSTVVVFTVSCTYILSLINLLVFLHLHCLQNITFTFTKSSQTYMWWNPTIVLALLYAEYHGRPVTPRPERVYGMCNRMCTKGFLN